MGEYRDGRQPRGGDYPLLKGRSLGLFDHLNKMQKFHSDEKASRRRENGIRKIEDNVGF